MIEDQLATEAEPQLPGWHPYPDLGAAHCVVRGSSALAVTGLRERVAREICHQARYLRRSVEHDIGGNHVLKNAAAFVFAGAVVPSGVFTAGVTLLRQQLDRQLLPDGGHEGARRTTVRFRTILRNSRS